MNAQAQLVRQQIDAFVEFLGQITTRQPESFDAEFHARLDRIAASADACPEHRKKLMAYCFEECGEHLDQSLIHRHCRSKPFGYAGDFLMIDLLYTGEACGDGVGYQWDAFANRQPGPIAVRNRLNFFGKTLEQVLGEKQSPITVLDLASGPCRDVEQALHRSGSKANGCFFHCVDIDNRAVAYAQDTVKAFSDRIQFQWQQGNVLLIKPKIKYDLVWSAGLFDYLPDRPAALLIKKMWRWTKAGGTAVIGNIHPRNPSRNYIEWCTDWKLIHRTQEDLVRLCDLAGIPSECVSFEEEPLGIIVFCMIHKPETAADPLADHRVHRRMATLPSAQPVPA